MRAGPASVHMGSVTGRRAPLGVPTPPLPCPTPAPQVAGAVSSLFILIIILKLGELFQDLPKVSQPPTPQPPPPHPRQVRGRDTRSCAVFQG